MALIEIARKRERRSDPILKFATAALELEQVMADLQNEIKSFTKIEMSDDGVPTVTGFSNESEVLSLQRQLNEVRSERDELLEIIAKIEKIFEEHGMQPCSMEMLDDRIKELGQIGRDMQRNGFATSLMIPNPSGMIN